MSEYSKDELIKVQSDLKIHEEKLDQLMKEYLVQRTETHKVIRNLNTILKENCIDGSGKHDWTPLMFYDYVCRECGVLK